MKPEKHPSIGLKLALDLAMVLLFIASLGFRTIGAVAHEWLGVSLFSLLIVHTIINWRWYRNIPNGKYAFRRCVNTVLNLLLPAVMLTLCVSGVMNSRHVFGFLGLNGGMAVRQIHSLAAYWGIALIGVHAGMHWAMVLGAVKKMAGVTRAGAMSTAALRAVALLMSAYGIWASFDRAMGSKLFLGFSFDFWDADRPEILFYANNLAIMALYISITHYTLKAMPRINARMAAGGTKAKPFGCRRKADVSAQMAQSLERVP
jgi:hypothetical protein